MAIARSMTIERDEGALVGLNLSGVDPSGVFLGKACAIAIQLLVLEVFLGVGIILLYGSEVEDLWLLISTGLFACIAVSALGTIFGFLASGLGVKGGGGSSYLFGLRCPRSGPPATSPLRRSAHGRPAPRELPPPHRPLRPLRPQGRRAQPDSRREGDEGAQADRDLL